jgi:hypothetical protein
MDATPRMTAITIDRGWTARHEAGHVAGLIMSGRVPASVTIDRPEEGIWGLTTVDLTADGVAPDTAADFAMALLLGPLAVAQPGWPPEWPLDPQTKDEDARQLAVLADYMKIDESGWLALVKRANEVAKSSAFKDLVAVVSLALEKLEALDSEEIRFLIGPEVCRDYGLEPTEEVATCST